MRYPIFFLLLPALSIPRSLPAQLRAPSVARMSPPAPPPASATATALGQTAVQLGWTPVPNAVTYRVSRAVDPNGPFVFVGVVPAGQTSLQDGGLIPGGLFYYRIEAMAASTPTIHTSASLSAAPVAVLTASAGTLKGPAPMVQRCVAPQYCIFNWQPVPGAVAYVVYDMTMQPSLHCDYGNARYTNTPEVGAHTKEVGCSESYQVAAMFEMKDFPTPGANYRAEGTARATFFP